MQENMALTEAVFYILLSLTEPMHGYGIMQNVAKLSRGRVNLAAGTLYGALSTLLEKGWIRLQPTGEGMRKKEYELTPFGRVAIEQETERLKELLNNAQELLGER